MYGISDVSDIGIGIGYPIFHLEKIGYRYRVRISYRPSPAKNIQLSHRTTAKHTRHTVPFQASIYSIIFYGDFM